MAASYEQKLRSMARNMLAFESAEPDNETLGRICRRLVQALNGEATPPQLPICTEGACELCDDRRDRKWQYQENN